MEAAEALAELKEPVHPDRGEWWRATTDLASGDSTVPGQAGALARLAADIVTGR